MAEFFVAGKMVSVQRKPEKGGASGIRPIAMGMVLRRLMSVLVLRHALTEAKAHSSTHKIDQVVSAATEQLVHGFRRGLAEEKITRNWRCQLKRQTHLTVSPGLK